MRMRKKAIMEHHIQWNYYPLFRQTKGKVHQNEKLNNPQNVLYLISLGKYEERDDLYPPDTIIFNTSPLSFRGLSEHVHYMPCIFICIFSNASSSRVKYYNLRCFEESNIFFLLFYHTYEKYFMLIHFPWKEEKDISFHLRKPSPARWRCSVAYEKRCHSHWTSRKIQHM